MIVVVLVIIVIVLLLTKYEVNRLKFIKKFNHIPSLKEYPFIGSLLAINKDMLNDIEQMANVFCSAPVTKFIVFNQVYITINDPAIIQQVLMSPLFQKRPSMLRFFEMENALFTSKYEVWKPLRKSVSPAFSLKSILSVQPKMHQHIETLMNHLDKHLDDKEFDIFVPLAIFEVKQIFDTLLDIKFNADDNFIGILKNGLNMVSARATNPLLYIDMIYEYSSVCAKIRKAHNAASDILRPHIGTDLNVKRKNLNKHSKSTWNFLNHLLSAETNGRKLSYEEIEENIKTILIAATDTSANLIGFVLLMVAMYPEIDEKVYEDISNFYSPGDELDYDTVKKMTYLDMVVKEALRLFPVAPVTMRECLADTHIDGVGMIPKGVTFFIIMYKIHRNPLIWGPHANNFNPENFAPENVSKRHPYSFIPFGGGGRNCIGIHYANLNMRLTLAKLLSTYRFSTKLKYENIKLQYGVSLKLNGPYLLKVHKRKTKGQ